MRTSQRAFTIVELLVVITIVGILAALSFAGYGVMARRGEDAKCLQNLKSIFAGLQSYAADNNGSLPTMLMGKTSKSDPGDSIETVLGARGLSPETFHCPADRKSLFDQSGSSYFWIYALAVKPDGTPLDKMSNLNLMTLDDPVKIPFVCDKEGFHNRGKGHILYADGHAE